MTLVMETTNSFAESFEREPGHARRVGQCSCARRGMERFGGWDFPTTTHGRNGGDTNVAAILPDAISRRVRAMVTGAAAIDLADQYTLWEKAAAAELVFPSTAILIRICRRLSGVAAGRCVTAWMYCDWRAMRRVAGGMSPGAICAGSSEHPFAALNTELFYAMQGGFGASGAWRRCLREADPLAVFERAAVGDGSGDEPSARAGGGGGEQRESSIVETYARAPER